MAPGYAFSLFLSLFFKQDKHLETEYFKGKDQNLFSMSWEQQAPLWAQSKGLTYSSGAENP